MKTKFIETALLPVAWAVAPWAVVIIPCEGGFHAFESVIDYQIHLDQN